jgi:hypothetical protein
MKHVQFSSLIKQRSPIKKSHPVLDSVSIRLGDFLCLISQSLPAPTISCFSKDRSVMPVSRVFCSLKNELQIGFQIGVPHSSNSNSNLLHSNWAAKNIVQTCSEGKSSGVTKGWISDMSRVDSRHKSAAPSYLPNAHRWRLEQCHSLAIQEGDTGLCSWSLGKRVTQSNYRCKFSYVNRGREGFRP